MKFKIGDKVKFLNQQGGGVISKIVSSNLVHVLIEDGFEIPTIISELVKVESNFPETQQEESNPAPKIEDNEPFQENSSPLKKSAYGKKQDKTVLLAFIPHDQKWLITGEIDICVINNTEYDVLYNLSLIDTQNGIRGIDYDVVGPFSKFIIKTIHHDEIEKWCRGNIQLMFHKEKIDEIKQPQSLDYKIKPGKFLKEEQYQQTDLLDERAYLYHLVTLTEIQEIIEEKKDEVSDIEKPNKEDIDHLLYPYMIDKNTAEVDLHIGQIVDDYENLEPHEIFNIQINHFNSCLEEALSNNLSRIIFIHGGGKGILKSEIIKELDHCKGLHYFDASYAKYGTGGIEVLIKQGAHRI